MSVAEEPAPCSGARMGEDTTFEAVWDTPKGWRVLSSVSHRVVGRRFIYTGFVFFLIAGVLALLVRTQLIVPGNDFLDLETYNQVFTMHGTLMMFLFAIPILEGFAVYLIPLMLGARDLIFPRLGQFGYYCYLFGGIIVLSSFLFDAAPDGGWFMYVPLSTTDFTPDISADFWLIGITFAEIASVTAAVELITAILCARAPGMSLAKMPIFAWYILITAFMIAIGFPPLIIGSILLEAERLLGLPFFDPLAGGDPLLWQHLFWLFGHPEVYIIFLPAAGMVATMLPTFVGAPLFGYGFAVAAVVSMGFISFGLWAHHMFATGLPILSLSLFSAASTMVAVPTGVQIFCFIATLASGRPRLTTPMLFILGFLAIFVLGGLTGVMLASVPFNWQAHDSYFVVAHLHYVLIGGMVFPLFGAFYYWAPHFSGRMLSERLGRWVFWLMFIGFNTTFLLMHLTGLRGMPRRIATYPEGIGWDRLNMLSSIGSYILAAGVALFVYDVFRSLRRGPLAPRNPWGAATLEWLYPPVTPGFNFHGIPPVHSREPLWDQPELLEREAHEVDGLMHGLRDGRRETLGCDPVTGAPLYILRLPHPTWVPMIAAAGLALMFGATLASVYWLCALGGVIALAAFAVWAWEPSDSGVERDVGMGTTLPVNLVDRRSHTHVGIVGTMLVLMALFASLIFGLLYLWNTQPQIAATMAAPLAVPSGLAGIAGLAVALFGQFTRHFALQGRTGRAALLAQLTAIAALLSGASLGWALLPVDPRATAFGATLWAIAGFVAINLCVVVFWALFNAARKLAGRVGPGQSLPDFNLATFAKGTGLMVIISAAFCLAGTLGGAAQ
ncbi:cytochrome c oxidase subunit I [Poseidonocella sedimentorum]|uniref:cytochrome-c oxidase n=1 Tax=Poseidonocella sedimentorum TaxID=871652 RepID=A0A1I6CV43_9RHOB|nr:cytochrome c oxidase subunit I [Poseidonocella sedimentorum]SFQ97105.1 cytochrome c oxidase subunit I+III [Poseidonocella sedimentorum]